MVAGTGLVKRPSPARPRSHRLRYPSSVDDEYKLRSDDTMRDLRRVAQAPGELEWRLSLVSAIERMRLESQMAYRSLLQNQKNTQKTLQSLTPVELAKSINREIDQREKNRDSERYRAGWKQFRNHLITAATSIVVAIVLMYWRSHK
jgi:hypothetical protein